MKTIHSLAILAGISFMVDARASNPNIIVILADDLGYGDISALDADSKIKTPNIDALCSEGIAFTDAHSNSSVSTPTRYGLLTGRYAFRTSLKKGVLNGTSSALITPQRTTMASMLSRMGYSTACIGKWHLGWDWAKGTDGKSIDYSKPIANGPVDVGFDTFFGISASLDMPPYVYIRDRAATAIPVGVVPAGIKPEFYRAGDIAPDFSHGECLDRLTDEAVKYIGARKGNNKPFFLYFPLTAPHTPIMPSKQFRGKSGVNAYGDFVMMVDDVVGQIRKTLKQNALDENTIIIFTADNGCSPAANIDEMIALGHYPNSIFRGHKADLFDGGHRVPMIVSWGERYKSRSCDKIICLTDLFATFAQMTGYQMKDNEGEDSFSFMPILLGENITPRQSVVHHSIGGFFSIRDSQWKLLVAPHSGGWSYPRPQKDEQVIKSLPAVQLYDMKNDVRETTNVQHLHPEIVAALSAQLEKIRTSDSSR